MFDEAKGISGVAVSVWADGEEIRRVTGLPSPIGRLRGYSPVPILAVTGCIKECQILCPGHNIGRESDKELNSTGAPQLTHNAMYMADRVRHDVFKPANGPMHGPKVVVNLPQLRASMEQFKRP